MAQVEMVMAAVDFRSGTRRRQQPQQRPPPLPSQEEEEAETETAPVALDLPSRPRSTLHRPTFSVR